MLGNTGMTSDAAAGTIARSITRFPVQPIDGSTVRDIIAHGIENEVAHGVEFELTHDVRTVSFGRLHTRAPSVTNVLGAFPLRRKL